MTIKNFAKERNISYDRAYRAAKAVILAAGKSMNAGRIPTEMDVDDVIRADQWLSEVGTKGHRSNAASEGRKEFERLRREWMEKWTNAAYAVDWAYANQHDPVESTMFAIVGLLSSASGPEWFDRPWGAGRLGDSVLKIAMRTDVDFDAAEVPGKDYPWIGFTGWLRERGYGPK